MKKIQLKRIQMMTLKIRMTPAVMMGAIIVEMGEGKHSVRPVKLFAILTGPSKNATDRSWRSSGSRDMNDRRRDDRNSTHWPPKNPTGRKRRSSGNSGQSFTRSGEYPMWAPATPAIVYSQSNAGALPYTRRQNIRTAGLYSSLEQERSCPTIPSLPNRNPFSNTATFDEVYLSGNYNGQSQTPGPPSSSDRGYYSTPQTNPFRRYM
ncbi:hypothetical protein L218DRAFT_487426 [Marasmius fiardii PR-910]|nr:hypothetical protein L218DRAFT_487426 [Marasmius fiardii PR-910]